jgi:hypothetical protein
MKRIKFLFLIMTVFALSACDKETDQNEQKKNEPTIITTDEQALDVAKAFWQLLAKVDEAIPAGYKYTAYPFSGAAYVDSMIVQGRKVNYEDYTLTELDMCYIQRGTYSGYVFRGFCKYTEKNYHYNSNYKRICQLDKYYDNEGNLYGLHVTGGIHNIDDIITITGSKDNYFDKSRNTDRIPAYFTVTNSRGDVFNVEQTVQLYRQY